MGSTVPSDPAGSRPEWQRSAIRRFALTVALIVAGLAVMVAADGGTADLVGWVLTGLGLTLATVFVFLEIGLSEDRDRATRGGGSGGGGGGGPS
jgi:heme/copper-type cytochrome/quinol oxidase subunit 3